MNLLKLASVRIRLFLFKSLKIERGTNSSACNVRGLLQFQPEIEVSLKPVLELDLRSTSKYEYTNINVCWHMTGYYGPNG